MTRPPLTDQEREAAHAELRRQVEEEGWGGWLVRHEITHTYDIEHSEVDLDKILDAAMGAS